jgi:L-malate glycosyltransferase
MKVAIIVTRLADLGPIKIIQNINNGLAEITDFTLDVYYITKLSNNELSMEEHARKLSLRGFNFTSYDVVHTSGIRPDFFAFINRRKIKYHISTIHNFVFEDLRYTYNRPSSWFLGTIWLILWLQADKLVCVSNQLKIYYSRWYSASKLTVIHNGIADRTNISKPDEDVIHKIESLRSNGLKIMGFAGILTKRKGIDQIINLLKYQNEFGLVILGVGKELSGLKKLACKLNVENRIVFCGFRSNAVNYFRYFDLVIVPSRSEGFGLALVEAIQQKIPVICSDITVFKELFSEDEVTFFKSDDVSSLDRAVRYAIELGNEKVEKAYTRYLGNYTDKIMAIHYFELYKSA